MWENTCSNKINIAFIKKITLRPWLNTNLITKYLKNKKIIQFQASLDNLVEERKIC